MVFIAVFSAYVFTDPVIAWLHMDPDTYKSAVAALVALSGEGIARLVISIANDPKKGIKPFQALERERKRPRSRTLFGPRLSSSDGSSRFTCRVDRPQPSTGNLAIRP